MSDAAPPLDMNMMDELLRFLPSFEAGAQGPATLSGGHRMPDGSILGAHVDSSETVRAFVQAANQTGFTFAFDWGAWEDSQRYWARPERLAGADLLDLRRMVTAVIRGDRFSDGTLEASLRNGVMVNVLRRLQELRAAARKG